MAHLKSAKKRLRQSEKLRERNKANRSLLKKELKSFEKAVQTQPAEAAKTFAHVQQTLDRAARKNAIPKRRASRKASRLALRLHKAQTAAPAPAAPATT